jgi:hypothetical protein
LSVSFLPLAVLPLATSPSPTPSQSTPTSPLPGESDSTWLGPGFLGFLSLVFLAVAVFVIYRSLTKQLARVTFDEAEVNHDAPPTAAGAAATIQAGAEPRTEPSAEPTDPAA